jgi:hemolysin activation/secretion protein
MNPRFPLNTLALLAMAACAGAHAQQAPLRNTPAAPASPASTPAGVTAPATTAVAPAGTQGSFLLKEVRFTPSKAFTPEELQRLVAPYLGRQIDATGLTEITRLLRQAFEARGFGMAGIGYPPQDLTAGVLQVNIVEPRVERISVEAPPDPPVSLQRTTRVLEAAGVRQGAPLDLQALDRAMYTLNDWPGVSAKTTLLPSGDEGLYRVNVQTERRRAWDASVDADNHGSSSSGRYRLGTLLRWNNPAGIGDNLDLRLMASSGAGTTVGRLGYEAPLGATPWRAGIGISRVGYELSEEFSGATGNANVVDASVSYPVLRSRERNLVARLGVQNKKLHDDIGGVITSDKTIRAAELSFAFESRDQAGGGGFNGGNLGFMFGKLDNRDASFADPNAPQGSFGKLSVQASRLQALGRGFSLLVGVAGQYTNKTLDNAERFTLGGDKGVRAYPVAEGSSDLGAIVNTELRRWFDPQWSGYVFYDWAHGRDKTEDMLTGDSRRTLHGYGLGVQFTHPDWFTLKASLGVRGKEPVRSEPENPKTRLLVQVQRSF